ncbi:MAG: glycosyltransferase [Pseudomonadota bacterium]
MSDNRPIASIVLVASSGATSIQKTLACLKAQTVAGKLEVVLSARPSAMDELNAIATTPFHSIKVVEADFTTSARARVPAIQSAQAEIIIFCEDHCFPTSADWAERMIDAHKGGHAAVGPRMTNANPETPSSWANLLIEYGPWVGVEQSGEVELLPGHNSSYKRDVLLSYGDALGDMLEVEWLLHRDLREKGRSLWIEADIASAHLNFSIMRNSIRLHLLEGWTFAASRAAKWSWPRRALYAVSFPAIFFVRAVRVSGMILGNPVSRGMVFPTFWMSYFFLAMSAAGEGLGYALGEQGSREALGGMEYDRWNNIVAKEKSLAFESDTGLHDPVENHNEAVAS